MIRICLENGSGAELALLQEFHQTLTAIELGLRGFIQIAAELGESGQFTVLSQFQFQGSGYLTHGFDLRGCRLRGLRIILRSRRDGRPD